MEGIVNYTSLSYIMLIFYHNTIAAAVAVTTTFTRFRLRLLWNVNIRFSVVVFHDGEML